MLPGFRQAPGFHRYLGGFDDDARIFVAVSLWETEVQARAVDGCPSPFGSLVRFDPAHVFEITAEA